MLSPSSEIIANLPAPHIHVEFAPDSERLYQIATPFFLSLAVLFAGWWLVRSRTLLSISGRVAMLACIGSFASCYVSWWVSCNWGANVEPTLESYFVVDMPAIIFIVAMVLCVSGRIVEKRAAKARGVRTDLWRELLLFKMMLVCFFLALPIAALTRLYFFDTMVASLWVFSLVVWWFVLLGDWMFPKRQGRQIGKARNALPQTAEAVRSSDSGDCHESRLTRSH